VEVVVHNQVLESVHHVYHIPVMTLLSKFTTPTHSVGTQLRAYINGVRQLESEYWSFTANSIIWF